MENNNKTAPNACSIQRVSLVIKNQMKEQMLVPITCFKSMSKQSISVRIFGENKMQQYTHKTKPFTIQTNSDSQKLIFKDFLLNDFHPVSSIKIIVKFLELSGVSLNWKLKLTYHADYLFIFKQTKLISYPSD